MAILMKMHLLAMVDGDIMDTEKAGSDERSNVKVLLVNTK